MIPLGAQLGTVKAGKPRASGDDPLLYVDSDTLTK